MSQEYSTIGLYRDAAKDIWVTSATHLSAAVILYYDYILTLDREIEFFWPPHNKQGWFTIACLLNRYIPMLGYLPTVISYFITSESPFCVGLHAYRESFMMVVQTHVGALCLFRVYALYGRSSLVLGFLGFIGLMSIVTAVGAFLAGHHAGGNAIRVSSSLIGCSNFVPLAEGRCKFWERFSTVYSNSEDSWRYRMGHSVGL